MSDHYILKDKKVIPCDDIMEWAAWYEDRTARRVALDEITPDIRVSTVFLGLDHQFGEGRPILFETLVFGGELTDEMERYSTWDEAEAGHAAMAERVRASVAQSGTREGER